MRKTFVVICLFFGGFVLGQGNCIRQSIKKPFSTQLDVSWYVSKAGKFRVNIYLFVNSLFDLFAKFRSSAGENLEIYKFKKRIAIYDRNVGKWIPYRKSVYVKGIRLLNLRKLFVKVMKLIDKSLPEVNQERCPDEKLYNLSVEKPDVEDILSFLFDKDEIPDESASDIEIKCTCSEQLQAINIKFRIVDNSTTIKGIIKFRFSIELKKKDFNIPMGIKRFLGK